MISKEEQHYIDNRPFGTFNAVYQHHWPAVKEEHVNHSAAELWKENDLVVHGDLRLEINDGRLLRFYIPVPLDKKSDPLLDYQGPILCSIRELDEPAQLKLDGNLSRGESQHRYKKVEDFTFKYGFQDTGFHEYFFYSDKIKKGRWLLLPDKKGWKLVYAKDQKPYRGNQKIEYYKQEILNKELYVKSN